jgi:hypothetical protein
MLTREVPRIRTTEGKAPSCGIEFASVMLDDCETLVTLKTTRVLLTTLSNTSPAEKAMRRRPTSGR